MKVDLNGRTALVTGAANGIGRDIALALASNGANVVVNDIRGMEETTSAEIAAMGVESLFLPADVSSREEVDGMIRAVEERFGGIDILVNNAGLNTPGPKRRTIDQYDAAEWHRILNVDLNGLFYCARAASAGMVARRSGTILNVASVMGMVPARLQSAFVAAKAAVINLSRSMALELGQYGIRVNTIAPGSTLTRATRAMFYNPENQAVAASLLSHIPLGRPAETKEIATAALFLVSPDASYITGVVLPVDGGWTAGYTRDW